MNAKKLLKTLGIAALVAAVTPYRVEKDLEKDELTCQALLWKITNRPHPDFADQRQTHLDLGLLLPIRHGHCDCCCDVDTIDLEDIEPDDCTPDDFEPCEPDTDIQDADIQDTETAPVEDAPAENSPVEGVPVEDAPTENSPVEDAPTSETSTN